MCVRRWFSGSHICHKVSRVSICTAQGRLFSLPNAASVPKRGGIGRSAACQQLYYRSVQGGRTHQIILLNPAAAPSFWQPAVSDGSGQGPSFPLSAGGKSPSAGLPPPDSAESSSADWRCGEWSDLPEPAPGSRSRTAPRCSFLPGSLRARGYDAAQLHQISGTEEAAHPCCLHAPSEILPPRLPAPGVPSA